jgi:hypothetical protein
VSNIHLTSWLWTEFKVEIIPVIKLRYLNNSCNFYYRWFVHFLFDLYKRYYLLSVNWTFSFDFVIMTNLTSCNVCLELQSCCYSLFIKQQVWSTNLLSLSFFNVTLYWRHWRHKILDMHTITIVDMLKSISRHISWFAFDMAWLWEIHSRKTISSEVYIFIWKLTLDFWPNDCLFSVDGIRTHTIDTLQCQSLVHLPRPLGHIRY